MALYVLGQASIYFKVFIVDGAFLFWREALNGCVHHKTALVKLVEEAAVGRCMWGFGVV